MMQRWLGLLSLFGMLACAGLDENDSAPRCSSTESCPDALICYRNFCIEEDPRELADGGAKADVKLADASTRDAAPVATTAVDAATSLAPDAGVASATPATSVSPPAAAPTPAAPQNVTGGRWRWPWGLDQIGNLPPYLLGCLGSCTIFGQKECETCVADKERQRGPESEYFCHRSDDDDEDGCGARR